MLIKVALFGMSEKGRFNYPYTCQTLAELADTFGNPPEDSLGLIFAIQAIMYEREVIFFRVQEEGFLEEDYIKGFEYLKDKVKSLDAICIPKVGNPIIIDKLDPICKKFNSIIITTEKDLFDYLIAK